jgi:heptosyltransferase-1
LNKDWQPSLTQNPPRILVVRLGAMGDIVHALPAVATLKQGFPGSHLTWVIEPQWAPLLEANSFVDRVMLLRRRSASGVLASWQELRSAPFDFAVDFQGLLKSAVVAAAARAEHIFGWERSQLREAAAGVFYTNRVSSRAVHVVDRNLDLAAAAGADRPVRAFPLPAGHAEGELPKGAFVLASPLAGWRAKQWPLEHYQALGGRLQRECNLPLVLNVSPNAQVERTEGVWAHACGLSGLIDATRRAAAVVGVDSGPMHLAAALNKPGVALFGPTDPARNGPYGDSLRVLRWPGAVTTYKRLDAIDDSMQRITPDEVFESLRAALGRARGSSGYLAG